MPKMKSNRLARKKIRVSARGKASHARAGTSHMTGKRRSKRNRQLRASAISHKANIRALQGLLPYAGVKG